MTQFAQALRRVPQGRATRVIVRMVYAQNLPGVGPLARFILWALGVDVPAQVTIGRGLRLGHPTAGLVVHPSTALGDYVTIYHNVTIGSATPWRPIPEEPQHHVIVGDGALLGVGATVLFTPGRVLVIGENAIVGAGAVVTRDVPPNEVWNNCGTRARSGN